MRPNLLSLVVDGVLAKQPKQPFPLPDAVELQSQLTPQQQKWRELIVGYIDGHIAPRYRALPSDAVPGAPGAAAQRWDLPPRILQALAPSASVTWTLPQTNHLPRAAVARPDYKLRGLHTRDDVAAGFALLGQYLSSQSLPAWPTASKVAATQAMNQLAAVDAFLVRWSGAIAAAAASRTSLAEMLALYRTEGDLIAPVSDAHVEDRLPTGEWLEDISMPEPHRSNIFPTMRRGLWSYRFDRLLPSITSWPPGAALVAALEPLVKLLALFDWMVVMGGLDFVAQIVKALGDQRSVESIRGVLVEFMVENRFGHGLPADADAQEGVLDAILDDIQVRWPVEITGRIVVAPETPQRLVAFVMTEAMLFFGLNKDWGQGPFIEPPASLRYLAYNLQHARSNSLPDDDRFIHLLASAAVAANRQSSPTFATLKAQLAPLGLRELLRHDPKDRSDEHVEEFQKLSAPPDAFLDDPANVDLLADFVLRAEHGHWNAFEKNRGNLARFRTLLAFYSTLLA
jgi:hypothetical protein